MKDNFVITDDYKQFIQHIKQTIQNSQIKAAISVNRELLNFYWNMGKRIVEKQKQTAWGLAGERDFISINQYVKNIPSLFLTFSAEVVFLSGLFKLLNTCNNPLRSNVV